jgi:ATPase family AAA domain-containing protein 1
VLLLRSVVPANNTATAATVSAPTRILERKPYSPTRLMQVWEPIPVAFPQTCLSHHAQERQEQTPPRHMATTILQHAPWVGSMALSLLLVLAGAAPPTRYTRAEAAALNRRDSTTDRPSIQRGPLPHVGPGGAASTSTTKPFSNSSGSAPYGSDNNVSMANTRSKNDDPGKAVALVLIDLAVSVGCCAFATYLANCLLKRLQNISSTTTRGDPDDGAVNGQAIQKSLQWIVAKRGGNFTIPALTHRELQMAEEILHPDAIDASFAQIGGLDHIKQEIYDLAIFPLVNPGLFAQSKLRQPPRGILLCGKPGTGKTMLAKAIANEAEAVFIPLQLSKILNKYWGESNKLIAAAFSLAHKLAPAVIFIDELDTFLKNSNSETAYMDIIKAEFLTLWDGVGTATNARVLVLGATNKPLHIDAAISRRMPRVFEVPLPDAAGRLAILKLILTDENVELAAREHLPQLAHVTVGYSGSDLKEMCRAAAMVSVQERTAEFSRRRVMGETTSHHDSNKDSGMMDEMGDDEDPIRPISVRDLEIGRVKVKRSGEAAQQYGAKENAASNDHNNNNNNNADHNRMDERLREALRRNNIINSGGNTIQMDELMRQLAPLLQAVLANAAVPSTVSPPNEDRIPNM